MNQKFSDIREKLKEDSKFKCQAPVNQQTEIVDNCPGVELYCQSLEIVEMFCYLGGQ